MAHRARRDKLTRRSWLLASLGIGVSFRASAIASMILRLDGDLLYVAAPDFHFLTGKTLDRLKDGGSVTFLAQLSLSLDDNRTILKPVRQRFIFSYDIWQEKFSVVRLGSSTPRRGLSAAAAEAWCLESLAITTANVPPDQKVWLRLDLRVADLKDQADMVGDPPISLLRLIETFAHPARTLQPHWTLDQPPFRLGDLKRAAARGPRGG
jgi:hypothetical protein